MAEPPKNVVFHCEIKKEPELSIGREDNPLNVDCEILIDEFEAVRDTIKEETYEEDVQFFRRIVQEESPQEERETYALKLAADQHSDTGVVGPKLKLHKEPKYNGQGYVCARCSYSAKSNTALKYHISAIHDQIKYPCKECDYAAKSNTALKYHISAIHDQVRYPCNECDYAATQLTNLKAHKKAKHEGIRYLCNQCDYKATQPNLLKLHKESKHDGIRYPCDECTHSSTTVGNLKTHKRNKHFTSELKKSKLEGKQYYYPCDQGFSV